jgi:hypothetical protein
MNTDEQAPKYTKGQQVEVYDVRHKRWYKAETLCIVQFSVGDTLEAWECRLRNGSQGMFDTNHMR